MRISARKAVTTTAAALGAALLGATATAAPASADIVIGCYSEANPPQAFGPGTVRAYGETTCGVQSSFVLEYRANTWSPWVNVTTSHSPGNGYYQYVYASPVPSGYFRASINHMPGITTYSQDVYLTI